MRECRRRRRRQQCESGNQRLFTASAVEHRVSLLYEFWGLPNVRASEARLIMLLPNISRRHTGYREIVARGVSNMSNENGTGNVSAPTAAPAQTPSPDRLSMIVSWFRGFRELIAVLIFFVTGLIWIVNYFATRAELEEYRCINDATVKMIQNTMDANFMDELIKGNRREARENHSRQEQQPHKSEGYKAISDILDDLSSSADRLSGQEEDSKEKS